MACYVVTNSVFVLMLASIVFFLNCDNVESYQYLSLSKSTMKHRFLLNGFNNRAPEGKDNRPRRHTSASSGSSNRKTSTGPTRATGDGEGMGIRQARISRSIRDELSDIICEGDIKALSYPQDDLLRSTCVTQVEVSADLSMAKVFISVIGNSVERRQVFVWLTENIGQVKYELSQRLRHMKRVPDILFKLSDNKETSELISLIDEVSFSGSEPPQDDYEVEEG